MNFSRQSLRKELVSLLMILGLVTFARSSLADHYYVPSGSMEYTLMPGDRVIVDKTAYGFRIPLTRIDLFGTSTPNRGDIAVFDSPTDGTRLIKRVVATGGDIVDLQDGHISINGETLLVTGVQPEDLEDFGGRSAALNLASGGGPDITSFEVPQDHVLMLGDHRGNSHDGRFFGTINARELFGRAVAIYYRREDGFVWQKL